MYEDLTPEYIKNDILEGFSLAETREGSYANTLVSPTAYEIWKTFMALNGVVPMIYIDETSGPYIDIRAGQYGITRKPGAKAVAEAMFYGEDGLTIPAGKVFLSADPLQFTLDTDVTIEDGSAQGRLTAVEIGEAYNAPAGAIFRQLINLTGLAVVESGAATGGTDAESDAALVGRYYSFLQRPQTSGNASHYYHWALEVDGIEAAKVLPLWDGPGTVKVLIAGPHNQPVDASITAKTAAHIESVRPIGAAVTVKSAEGRAIDVSAVVILRQSTDAATVQEAFERSLSRYLESIAFSEFIVVYHRIGHILLDLPGVVDYTSLIVNGGTADIILDSEEVPVVGTVEVSV